METVNIMNKTVVFGQRFDVHILRIIKMYTRLVFKPKMYLNEINTKTVAMKLLDLSLFMLFCVFNLFVLTTKGNYSFNV